MALSMRKFSAAVPVMSTQRRVVSKIVCQSHSEDSSHRAAIALPFASIVAAAMICGAVNPEEALAARSSGRAGGSSGFSSRRAYSAPAQRANTARPGMSSTTVVVAPSVFSPPMFSPFGYGGGMGMGMGYGGGMGMGFSVFSSLFQFMFLALIVSVAFNVIRGIGSSNNKGGSNKKDDDGWGDL